MKFWDTSAIVSLCVNEPTSSTVKPILAEDPAIVVWWATRTECVSAFVRQVRERGLNLAGEKQARHLLETLAQSWIEVQPTRYNWLPLCSGLKGTLRVRLWFLSMRAFAKPRIKKDLPSCLPNNNEYWR